MRRPPVLTFIVLLHLCSCPPRSVGQDTTPKELGTISKGQNGKLRKIKRIRVASFGEDGPSRLLRAMVIDSLIQSNTFTLTEDELFFDATLKGVGIETTGDTRLSVFLVASNGKVIWTCTVREGGDDASKKAAKDVVEQLFQAWQSAQKSK